jgi:hypothetical protein
MSRPYPIARFASRIARNLTAVVAISAIFGFKALLDEKEWRADADRAAARQAQLQTYEPYFTEQP